MFADRLGGKIAALVKELTDDKSLPKQKRKKLQVEHAPRKSDGACVIKLPDKTSNLRAIAKSAQPWPSKQKREYLVWARKVVAGLPHKPGGLHAEFEKAAAELEAILR